jgi:hypothetical protein
MSSFFAIAILPSEKPKLRRTMRQSARSLVRIGALGPALVIRDSVLIRKHRNMTFRAAPIVVA